MKRSLTACVVCAFLGVLAAHAWAQPGGPRAYRGGLTPTHTNVAYATTSPAQAVDLFVPAGKGPFPLVINVHGGAFRMGSKEMLDAPIARALLDAGIAVASLNYRLSGEARFPAAVQDVKAAVRFLRANAPRYNLDPDRFLAFGQSAGGNLVSMLGTSGGVARFDDPALGHPAVSSRVQGVIDWFGPSDFAAMDAHAKTQGCPPSSQEHSRPGSPESDYLGGELATVPDLVAQANPITYISKDDPPFLLQKGERDCTVPVGQSQLLHEALKAGGVPVEFDLLPGVGHGDAGAAVPIFLGDANVAKVVAFARRILLR